MQSHEFPEASSEMLKEMLMATGPKSTKAKELYHILCICLYPSGFAFSAHFKEEGRC